MNNELPDWLKPIILSIVILTIMCVLLCLAVDSQPSNTFEFYCPKCKKEITISIKKAKEVSNFRTTMTHTCGENINYSYNKPEIKVEADQTDGK